MRPLKFKLLPLVEGKEYGVRWLNWRTPIMCTFQKVTDKGYNFVKPDGTFFLKRHLYKWAKVPEMFSCHLQLHIEYLTWPKKIQKDPEQ